MQPALIAPTKKWNVETGLTDIMETFEPFIVVFGGFLHFLRVILSKKNVLCQIAQIYTRTSVSSIVERTSLRRFALLCAKALTLPHLLLLLLLLLWGTAILKGPKLPKNLRGREEGREAWLLMVLASLCPLTQFLFYFF
jgi:hypothetical protein